MATQTTNNKTAWWKRAWRAVSRRTPYWQRRMEDEQEARREDIPTRINRVIRSVVEALGLGLLVLLPALYLVQVVFLYPGGLAGFLGRQMADICTRTGRCDFDYLMAGLAFALVFVIVALGVAILPFRSEPGNADALDALAEDVAAVDERIIRLRDELKVAGIPLPKEPEVDGD